MPKEEVAGYTDGPKVVKTGGTSCAAVNCHNRKYKLPHLSLFRFPGNKSAIENERYALMFFLQIQMDNTRKIQRLNICWYELYFQFILTVNMSLF